MAVQTQHNFDPFEFRSSIDDILAKGGAMAKGIGDEERRRYDASLSTLTAGAAAFDRPSMTDQDISRMYSGAAEAAGAGFQKNMGNLRQYIGATGQIGGGHAASLATNYEAMRLASLTDATRSLYEKRIETDMADRAAKWSARQAVAAAQARDPSMVEMDWLGASATTKMTSEGIIANYVNATKAAKASKSAGQMGMWGSLIGAGLSAL